MFAGELLKREPALFEQLSVVGAYQQIIFRAKGGPAKLRSIVVVVVVVGDGDDGGDAQVGV